MQFLKTGQKVSKGFRVSDHDRSMISSVLGQGEGTLQVNVVRVSDGYKEYGLKAIWSSGKIRLVDQRFVPNEYESYVLEVVSIKHRNKGDRV